MIVLVVYLLFSVFYIKRAAVWVTMKKVFEKVTGRENSYVPL